ncbi:MAG: hypothetical protein ACYTGF_16335, partial [Planctomycetota bacterium]
RVQGKLILEAGGADEETVARTRLQQEKFFELVLNNADEETLREALRPMIEAELAAMGMEGEQSEQLEQMLEAQTRLQASPWMRYFITYDPRPALGKVRCPVLALNGTLDLQVWHEQNLPEIEKAIKAPVPAGRDRLHHGVRRHRDHVRPARARGHGGVDQVQDGETSRWMNDRANRRHSSGPSPTCCSWA